MLYMIAIQHRTNVHTFSWITIKDYRILICYKCLIWVELLHFPRNWSNVLDTLLRAWGELCACLVQLVTSIAFASFGI